ncbi:MAG TPA: hypothetical protein VM347_24680 [Nonomuraea sp.]|nr:hypothetical protein [Nonomuraea sp.]
MGRISGGTLSRKSVGTKRRNIDEWRDEIRLQTGILVEMVEEAAAGAATLRSVETVVRQQLWNLGRAAAGLFLELSEERVVRELERHGPPSPGGRRLRRAPAIARGLLTIFGVVWYWRTYLREAGPKPEGRRRRGYHPLDAALGLDADRVSSHVIATGVRLATRMSYEEAVEVGGWCMPQMPSTEVLQQATLGLGEEAAAWLERATLLADDGEVLVILIDSKGAPTATEEELQKRRGPRKSRPASPSPRHRGRDAREGWTHKPRRKKGDKSKNAKMATMVVMYTLRRQGGLLLGPINKRFYASFAPKRHAVEYARRQATARGFGPDSGRKIQVLTDGDNDLRVYIAELFPTAMHTLDIIHAMERVWKAGECFLKEGSAPLRTWVDAQREDLLKGNVTAVLGEMQSRLDAIAKTGPGNKGRRARLAAAQRYLAKRVGQLNYRDALELDLELGTGAVEGAIKNIIGKRFDHGGMRWIKERAEAVLRLRCIDANGDWDAFTQHVHDRRRQATLESGLRSRLQRAQPVTLGSLLKAA